MNDLENHILDATNARRIVRKTVIQDLWSGYGKISRYYLEGGNSSSVVVKHVQLPTAANHPRGWNTDTSHLRKHKSYQVEINWYKGLGQHSNDHCKIPKLYFHHEGSAELLMIMEDLNDSGYPDRKTDITISEIKVCLSWLANFHANFMLRRDENLWEIGSYWHLATRQDELENMLDKDLQQAAAQIDSILNNAKYQTIIHGDAKLANFCFAKGGKKVAAVDFQYVGHGSGMKDVAYFMSSCLDSEALFEYEESLLKFYFDSLTSSLHRNKSQINFQELKEEWSELYAYAWTDFYRFLDGWSPGHWKMTRYSESIKNKVLKHLK